MLNSLERKYATINSYDIIETICIETNYYNYLMTKEDGELCYANIEKLKSIAYDFEDKSGKNVYDFVIGLTSVVNDISYASVPKLSVEAVKVMTIHKSKGLEFKNVFLAGAGYNRNSANDRFDFIEDFPVIEIPVHNYIKDYNIRISEKDKEYNRIADLSEKRRLLYVALTRAGENLTILGEGRGKNTYRGYINDYIAELKELNNKISSESQKELIEIKDIKNDFVNFYSYGRGIKSNEKNDIKNIAQINEKLKNIPNNIVNENKIKNNEINNIQYVIPSKIGVKNNFEEDNFKNIGELLNKKLSNLEFEKENDYNDYEEKIKISPTNMGTIMHELFENFDFDKYLKDKENYIEKLKIDTLKYYKYYDNNDLKDKLDKYFNNFIKNEHIKNIINGNEKIISREHKFQSRKLENEIIFIIPAKIDLITQNSEGKYFILDYKTSKKSEEKIAFYKNQLNEYKKIIKEVFNIENLEELKTDIIFLG